MATSLLAAVLLLVAGSAVSSDAALGGAAASAPPSDLPPEPGDLPPELDNGKEGTETCHGEPAPSGSRIERRLPDGPRLSGGTLAFTSGVCVYLPPGYHGSGLRYPVLYLLHGGGGDQSDWVDQGGVQAIADAAYGRDARNALIVVMPGAGENAGWFDTFDETVLNQRYVLDHLLPWVESRYRTIPRRPGRALAGLSNGGHGAMHLAARAPDRFIAAGSMSGNVGWKSFNLGRELYLDEATGEISPSYFHGVIPKMFPGNLDRVDLILDTGASCASDLDRDLCGSFAFDQVFLQDNRDLVSALRGAGHVGALDYRETEGGHAWRWWHEWLEERQLPFLLERLADPRRRIRKRAPVWRRPFRYRTIAQKFSVFGWRFSAERPPKEFMSLEHVRKGGLTAIGSGALDVVTAPRYRRGRSFLISGAGDEPFTVVAGRGRRLRFRIDLGPAHDAEQFATTFPEPNRGTTDPEYFVTREVRITRFRESASAAPARR